MSVKTSVKIFTGNAKYHYLKIPIVFVILNQDLFSCSVNEPLNLNNLSLDAQWSIKLTSNTCNFQLYFSLLCIITFLIVSKGFELGGTTEYSPLTRLIFAGER